MAKDDRVELAATDAPPFPIPSPSCGALTSPLIAPETAVKPFASVREATRVAGLMGEGLVATSCVGKGWDYLVTRSIAHHYPRGDVSSFFAKEAVSLLRLPAPLRLACPQVHSSHHLSVHRLAPSSR